MLMPIELPPGQYRNGTDLQSTGRWRDASLVRWHEGSLRPVGGWEAFKETETAGVIRSIHAWRANNGHRFVALGGPASLQVYNRERQLIDITPADLAGGQAIGRQAVGYGVGAYGRGAYGSDYTNSSVGLDATIWSIDNWGQDLVACSGADGRIFYWARDETATAQVVAGAPTGNAGIVVSDNRFLFALGANGDPRNVAWCDREDYTVWTPTATNEAGDYTLNTSGNIITAVSVQGEVLIFTDNDAHVARYVGPQLVHSFERAGTSCGIIGKNAVEVVDGTAFWMGVGGFFAYQGGVVQRIQCDVSDYVFGEFGPFTGSHVHAMRVSEFSEIWWFYTSNLDTENDRYVVFNYDKATWATGALSRTAGLDRGVHPYPLAVGSDLVLYEHEKGFVPFGFPVYAESGPFMIGTGDNTFTATKLYPDERTAGEVTATFKTRRYPNGPESTHGPYMLHSPTSVRFTGRQGRMRVDGVFSKDFRVGIPRLDVQPRGKR